MKPAILILAAASFCFTRYPAAAQVPFALSTSLTNGTFVRGVTTADVNGDGKPDLIAVRGNPSFVYVWTNAGNGLFISNASYAVGGFPYQVIAADVNGDGWPDLITANNSGNSLTVLTNDGTGNFVLAATLAMGSGTAPHSVAAADLFGRGRPDLISANSQAASFAIWTNMGGGNFASNTSFTIGTPQYNVPQWVTTADVNGDGKPDIIGAGNDDYPFLFVWTNNGAGGFASAPVPPVLSGITCVVAVDVNGDGKPDLVLNTGQLTVLTNNGAGGFAVVPGGSSASSGAYALAAADVNGDGSVDIIACNSTSLIVFTNNGSGVFGSNTLVSAGAGSLLETVAVADVNGDGRMDLITGNWNSPGALTVFTNASSSLPYLTLGPAGNNVIVSWPAVWANWTLQQTTNLAANWTPFSGAIGNNGLVKRATNSSPVGSRFFRLSHP